MNSGYDLPGGLGPVRERIGRRRVRGARLMKKSEK